jgi:hypothetical protein
VTLLNTDSKLINTKGLSDATVQTGR